MKKNVLIIILLSLGVLTGGVATIHRLVVTSDIPVSYSSSEAISIHILFCLSTLLLLLASSTFRSNKSRMMTGYAFLLLFIINLSIFKIHTDAEYFNSSYAQLQISSLLNSGILMFFNFYLMLKEKLESTTV